MPSFIINGGNSLYGEVAVSSAKNSVLPLMCASVLVDGGAAISDCPFIGDVTTLCMILSGLGAKVERNKNDLYINADGISASVLDKDLTEKIRASLFLAGPLLYRFGSVTLPHTGGCSIGERPIDIHLDGFMRLGAKVSVGEGGVKVTADNLHAAKINLRYPSVGATENLIMASVLLSGETVITNAAREPEVKDLCDFLNSCGAKISGGGKSAIYIRGVKKLRARSPYRPISDRIEAGTFLIAAYMLGGKIVIKRTSYKNIYNLIKKIRSNTCVKGAFYVNIYSDKIFVCSDGCPKAIFRTVTGPYPLFPTDLHPILSAALAVSRGASTIVERVFDSRFSYLDGLKAMGADFFTSGNAVTFLGRNLHGAFVTAPDLRGGAALSLAAMKASGESRISCCDKVLRGYDNFVSKFRSLGVDISLSDD